MSGTAAGAPRFEAFGRRPTALPFIVVPTITLDGDADGVVPVTDGASTAAKFGGPRTDRAVRNVGHNLPQDGGPAAAPRRAAGCG